MPWSRIAASALAVALTIAGQIPARAGHAPATATTLLITLGGFAADTATVVVMVIGIGLSTVLCDGGRGSSAGNSDLGGPVATAPIRAMGRTPDL